jgi:hypothetical protein
MRWLAPVLALAGLTACTAGPTATVVGARITELTTEKAGLALDVRVDNPWLVPLPLAEARGRVFSAQIDPTDPFLQLAGGSAAPVPQHGARTVPLEGTLAYWPLLTHVTTLHAGDEVRYRARLRLAVNTPPGNQRLDLPELVHEGTLPILGAPQVSIKSVGWPTLSWERVSGTVTLAVTNTNRFAIGPGSASGRLLLRRQVFTSGDTELSSLSAVMPGAIGGHRTGDVQVTAAFHPKDLFDPGMWAGLLLALVDQRQLRARGTIVAQTPYIPVQLSFDSQ